MLYQRFKIAAEEIDQLPRQGRDFHIARCSTSNIHAPKSYPQVTLDDILLAFEDLLQRIELRCSHHIQREPLSVRERTSNILHLIAEYDVIHFTQCFSIEEGRAGLVVSLLAILELLRSRMIEAVQAANYSDIQLRLTV